MVSFIHQDVVLAEFRHSRWAIGTLLAAVVGLIGWFLLVAPVLLAFVAVVAGAIAWCIWLERHPEPERRGQESGGGRS